MFAKGLLVLAKTQPSTVVPFSAIREDAGQMFVFTLENGKLAKRNVTLGMREEQAGLVQVKTGLETGTQVVSARMVGLKTGAPAVVKLPGATPAAPAPTNAAKAS